MAIMEIKRAVGNGYALIEYENLLATQNAISKMNGARFLGRTISVDWGKLDSAYRGNWVNLSTVLYTNEIGCLPSQSPRLLTVAIGVDDQAGEFCGHNLAIGLSRAIATLTQNADKYGHRTCPMVVIQKTHCTG
ncbi:hypothetical protein RJ639_026153 [Escallonia herrerae]|uniref:RRM domain-containing protein n=1 Tax=Escallonia herrerae TaxID=1293975 RepID=A0AA88UXK5_9ASTE|nr:hypothetical protein RJ639_026153 [Escallonia herrerae]